MTPLLNLTAEAEPNHALEPTAYSLRSFLASAFGGGSLRAFGARGVEKNLKGPCQGEQVRYTKIVATEDGGSRFEEVDVVMHTARVVDGVPPLRVSAPFPATGLMFVEQRDGATDWGLHVVPRRQFVFILSGRITVQTSDGSRREFGPGDFVLAEDTTGVGHLTTPMTSDVRLGMVPVAE